MDECLLNLQSLENALKHFPMEVWSIELLERRLIK